MLQDVAYGVTKIKHDSGEEQKIVYAILSTKFSHTITFYIESCKIASFHLYLNPVFGRFYMPLNFYKESLLQDLMM